MNKTFLILFLFVNNLLATSWLEKYYGIINVSSVEIYKYEQISCENGSKTICCRTKLDKNDTKTIKNAECFISSNIQDFYYQEAIFCGFMIINNKKVIWFYDSFKFPCNNSDSTVQIIGNVNERIKYLKSKDICTMLNKIEWEEITTNEYNARGQLKPYIKPDYNKSIDSLFTDKEMYRIGKQIGNDGDCEKGKKLKRIN
jgi:hypothetical protein